MSLRSMTGFSSLNGEVLGMRWRLELKSVNAKGLYIRVRVPHILEAIEVAVRDRARKRLGRGNVSINLHVDEEDRSEVFDVNTDRLEKLIDVAESYRDSAAVAPPRLDGLLALRGVVELKTQTQSQEDLEALSAAVLKALEEGLDLLIEARAAEGDRLGQDLAEQLRGMRGLLVDARREAGDRVEAMKVRFTEQLERVLSQGKVTLDPDRLEAEIALLAVKADVQEELDRLDIHFDEADRLLTLDEPVGRRLDFLCQEFNREANTLCSKSGNAALTKIGLDLKARIDQFREQIQNIE